MKAGIFSAVILILALEILRHFRDSKRIIKDVDELKLRVEYLENKIKTPKP